MFVEKTVEEGERNEHETFLRAAIQVRNYLVGLNTYRSCFS